MYRPGEELYSVNRDNYKVYLFRDVVDAGKLCSELDSLMDIFRSEGVEVLLLNDMFDEIGWRPSYIPPNMFFMRDVMAVFEDSVIISYMRYEIRRFEPIILKYVIEKAYGWEIVIEFRDGQYFEGGDLLYLNDDTLMVGYGPRTSFSSAYAIGRLALDSGFDVILVPLPSSRVHLDGAFMVIDKDIVVTSNSSIGLYPSLIWFGDRGFDIKNLYSYFKSEGYVVIDVEDEELDTFGANIVVLGDGKVLMYSWNKGVERSLTEYGIDVIPFDGYEIMKAGGGLHCTFNTIFRGC
jgi:N-dimethylarginine dimethylaminohydrolase